jgi:hypothetical protein
LVDIGAVSIRGGPTVRFFQRHRLGAAYAEALLWLLLILQATRWDKISALDWILILMLGASAVDSLMRARRVRHERKLSNVQSAA